MNIHSVRGLAVAAALSLAACAGDGGSGSQSAPAPDHMWERAGLSAPGETGPEQHARQQDIFPRADSLIMSTLHVETVFPDEIHILRFLPTCTGSECTLFEPVTGTTDTASLDMLEASTGELEPIGSAHGITLMSESWHDMGLYQTSLGAWMQHGWFGLSAARRVEGEAESTILNTLVAGDLTGRPLAGSATWLGIMVGTTDAGDDRGDRLVGTAALNYDLGVGGLDAAFSGIRNMDRDAPHGVETVVFSDLAIEADGTFARGQSGARIQGAFYGPEHAEAAGIFEQSDIIGAFGAKRQ